MTEEKKVVLTFDDKEYTEDQLTDTAKIIVEHCNRLAQKVQSARFNLAELERGQAAFVNDLREELQKIEEAA